MTAASPDIMRHQTDLSDREFRRISQIASMTAGLVIPEAKAAMVHSRLSRRMRKLSIGTIEEYIARVENGDADELKEMISVLTTNVTSFFREDHHFQRLIRDIAPGLLKNCASGGKARIWSAGCSTGAEPYSVAISLLDHSESFARTDLKILATDIDQNVLSTARSGTYRDEMLNGISDAQKKRYFSRQSSSQDLQVKPALRDLIRFRELNLIRPWPMSGMFDVIFCRNVVIYFDQETQSEIWEKFRNLLNPGGWLFVGHSERVPVGSGFVNVGMTTYRREPVSRHI